MELNHVELALKEIYDGWQFGNEKENNGYSAMFRMGFPDEYIDSDRPLLMYVGQEDLNGNEGKTQEWVRKYQIVQLKKSNDILPNEKVNKSPFWNFFRRLCKSEYDVVWNNLNKFLKDDHKTHIEEKDAVNFNTAYGTAGKSVFQREIACLKPDVILLVIGPKREYIEALASAFSVDPSMLYQHKPSREALVHDISNLLGLEGVTVLWTYHPAYLQRIKAYNNALQDIIDVKLNR